MQASGADKAMKPVQRTWVYMTFMHSEVLADQDVSERGTVQTELGCSLNHPTPPRSPTPPPAPPPRTPHPPPPPFTHTSPTLHPSPPPHPPAPTHPPTHRPPPHPPAPPTPQECVALFTALAAECAAAGYPEMAASFEGNVKYAVAHQAVVKQWGRFPHRNGILGRQSTPEEEAALAAGTVPKF